MPRKGWLSDLEDPDQEPSYSRIFLIQQAWCPMGLWILEVKTRDGRIIGVLTIDMATGITNSFTREEIFS